MLTATAMSFFEQEIARAVVLALFVPLIISKRWQFWLASGFVDYPRFGAPGIETT